MYLEQSLFGLHRALSRLLPNKLLIALMMLLLAVLLKEMVSWASQESLVDLNNCLQEYYDRTRTMMHNPSTNLTEKQAGIIVDNQTLLNIHFVSDQTHKCTIVLNSNFSVHNNS